MGKASNGQAPPSPLEKCLYSTPTPRQEIFYYETVPPKKSLSVDFHCCICFFFVRTRNIYVHQWNTGNVWKATLKRKSLERFNSYIYAWPSIHHLYFIYTCKNHAKVEISLYSMLQTRSPSWRNATLILRRRYPPIEIRHSHERELTKSCKYEYRIRFR